jgi:hypothetical protein
MSKKALFFRHTGNRVEKPKHISTRVQAWIPACTKMTEGSGYTAVCSVSSNDRAGSVGSHKSGRIAAVRSHLQPLARCTYDIDARASADL